MMTSCREPPAHPVDLGEAVGIDQAAQGLAGLARRWRTWPGTRPARATGRRLLAVWGWIRKARTPLGRKSPIAPGVGAQRVDDRRPDEPVGVQLDHVKHVAVVELVEAIWIRLTRPTPPGGRSPATPRP